ncbi:hypothetical protein ACFE04_025772 [Oxalis oulophora]
MEDTEILDQDTHNADADASVRQQEAAKHLENQNFDEKEDDKTYSLPGDVKLMNNELGHNHDHQMMENKIIEDGSYVQNIHETDVSRDLVDNQIFSNEPDDIKVISVDGYLSVKDDDQMMENENNKDATRDENIHESDVSTDLIDDQVLCKQTDKNEAAADGNLKADADNDEQMTENNSNGDGTHVENNHEIDVSLDSKLTDNQVFSKEPNNNEAPTNENLGANSDNQITENISNGDVTHVENNHEPDADSDPHPISVILPPKVTHENVRKFKTWLNEAEMGEAGDTGTPGEVAEFMKELETFHRINALDYKPPKFYGEPLNCLKLWRAVIRLGGYELVTACKLWRQVGESFHPPKTCTTVSWTFRIFYEKITFSGCLWAHISEISDVPKFMQALLEFEKHVRQNGELPAPTTPFTPVASVEKDISGDQATGSGRQRRDAASRARQGWHSQRNLGNGEVGEPIIKNKSANSSGRHENHIKNIGLPKHKAPNNVEFMETPVEIQAHKQLRSALYVLSNLGFSNRLIPEIVDIGPPADWVKINVRESKDCFEVYALIPGLVREEVRVQSDPVGRLVITGQPEQVINPWGITPFKKVVNLPGRIDPVRTSALVSLHGRLFVRVPFEQEST